MLGRICIFLCFAMGSSLSHAGRLVTYDKSAVVQNEYVVVFSDDKAQASRAVSYLTEAEKGGKLRIIDRWTTVINGAWVEIADPEIARMISTDMGVETVYQNKRMIQSATQLNARPHLARLSQRNLPMGTTYTYSYTGNGAHAYVVDSGIRTTHEEFKTNGVSRADNVYFVPGLGPSTMSDHATMMASVIGGNTYGVAKKIKLHGVVIGVGESRTTAGTISGLNWIGSNGIRPAVVSLSSNGGVPATTTALNNLAGLGFFIAVSAGNSDSNICDDAVAGASEVFTVSGVGTDDARGSGAYPAGYGPCVDAFAEYGVYGATALSDTTVLPDVGTSFAAPVAAGLASFYIESGYLTGWSLYSVHNVIKAELINIASPAATNVPAGTTNRILYSVTAGN